MIQYMGQTTLHKYYWCVRMYKQVYNFVQHACLHTITHVTQVTTHIVVIKSFSDNTLVGGITLLVRYPACMCERNEMGYGPYHVSCDIDSFKDTITCPHLYVV